MYELAIFADHQLFLWINHWPHTLVLNSLALGLSGLGMGGFIWLILSVIVFLREEKKDHWFFLPVVLSMAMSELVTEVVLKNLFARPRPPLALGTILVAGPSSDYSFPSGHATFAWSLAVVLAAKEPRAKYFFWALAFFISLSRVYLGKHYPADIIAGSFVGILIGGFSLLVERIVIQYQHAKAKRKGTPYHRTKSRGGKIH